MRAVALGNDRQQFAVHLKPRIEGATVERHEANGELSAAYSASDERRDLVDEFLVRSLYDDIRRGRAS